MDAVTGFFTGKRKTRTPQAERHVIPEGCGFAMASNDDRMDYMAGINGTDRFLICMAAEKKK
jgi:hypothetical protein